MDEDLTDSNQPNGFLAVDQPKKAQTEVSSNECNNSERESSGDGTAAQPAIPTVGTAGQPAIPTVGTAAQPANDSSTSSELSDAIANLDVLDAKPSESTKGRSEKAQRIEKLNKEFHESLSDEQKKLFLEFQRQVDPERKRVQHVLIRFLYLAKFDIELAVDLLRRFDVEWEMVDKTTTDEEVITEFETGKWAIAGRDSEGRLIVNMYYALHHPAAQSYDCSVKTCLVLMDCLLEDLPTCQKGLVFVTWMGNSSMANFSLPAEIRFIKVFNALRPASFSMMNDLVLVDSPWYVWYVMKLCKPFVSDDIMEKLKLVSREELNDVYSPEQMEDNCEINVTDVAISGNLTRFGTHAGDELFEREREN